MPRRLVLVPVEAGPPCACIHTLWKSKFSHTAPGKRLFEDLTDVESDRTVFLNDFIFC